MAASKFVSYVRVSTDKQGKSGLGLEAQREAVTRYLNGGQWKLVAEYVEVESGKRNSRPQLQAAISHADDRPAAAQDPRIVLDDLGDDLRIVGQNIRDHLGEEFFHLVGLVAAAIELRQPREAIRRPRARMLALVPRRPRTAPMSSA